ncbi:MAG: pre-peptidase C-terminal domain-containing protein [Pseudomonadota bacterium]
MTGAATYQFDLDQTAHHGDFDPASGYFFGVGNTNSTTPLVIIDVANRAVVNSFETGEQLHALTFTAGTGDLVPGQDWYSITLQAGELASFVLGGASGTGKVLDLYDALGVHLATGSADAVNTELAIRDFLAPNYGTYYVKVSGLSQGDYNLLVTKGAAFEREDNDLAAQDITPSGAVLGYQDGGVDLYRFEANAGDLVTLSTLTPGDGAGEPVNSLDPAITLYGPDGSPVGSDQDSADGRNASLGFLVGETGTYTVAVTAQSGAGEYRLRIENASGAQLPFQVVASQPADNSLLLAFPNTYRVTLSEQVLLSSVEASDLTVNGVAAESVTVIDGNTLEFGIGNTFANAAEYQVAIAAAAMTSLSGQSIAGYNALIDMDADTQPYPVPLAAIQPTGSLIYDPAPTGLFHAAGDADDYTLEIEAGQVLTVILHTKPSVRGGVIVIGPDGVTQLGTGEASGLGEDALAQSIAIQTSGVYTIRALAVEGAGEYQVQALLNAAAEAEPTPDSGLNDSLADAQDINASFISLGSTAERGAVRGNLAAADEDWFAFALQPGDISSMALSRDDTQSSRLALELYNASGSLIAAGASDSLALDAYIKDFVSAAGGTYYLRVSGGVGGYSVVVTRNIDFDMALADSQDISQTNRVLGFVGGAVGGGAGTGTSGSTSLSVNLYDASGYLWDIQRDGDISNGIYDAYDGGMVHTGFPSYSSALTEEGGARSSSARRPSAVWRSRARSMCPPTRVTRASWRSSTTRGTARSTIRCPSTPTWARMVTSPMS